MVEPRLMSADPVLVSKRRLISEGWAVHPWIGNSLICRHNCTRSSETSGEQITTRRTAVCCANGRNGQGSMAGMWAVRHGQQVGRATPLALHWPKGTIHAATKIAHF